MFTKIPIISTPVTLADIGAAAGRMRDGSIVRDYASALSRTTGLAHVTTAGSGIACYYLMLAALKERYGRTEVILPAYTAGSLVVAIRKAGLRPILVDVSLGDLNMDVNELAAAISERTLAVTAVHMFGIGMEAIERIRPMLPPGAVLIEDCCQSMGTVINGKPAGSFGDISFFSFNRGKNLPLSGGGCMGTNADVLEGALRGPLAAVLAPERAGIAALIKNAAFMVSQEPHLYGALFPLLSCFKETAPPTDITVGSLTRFDAALGLALLPRCAELARRRYENGMAIVDGLKDIKGLQVPVIPTGVRSAFNRLPVVFDDAACRTKAEWLLRNEGIETSRMYFRPLHRMFDLGYPAEAFPHANYAAQRLLTLPVHPGIRREHIDRMVGTVRASVRA